MTVSFNIVTVLIRNISAYRIPYFKKKLDYHRETTWPVVVSSLEFRQDLWQQKLVS